ncbi:MAG: sulfatase [Verrucomicrobia bacterium]|mgnify:CR=1 FL=1|jgi:arylsulfatase A-like enzyme|nr:sulfatase [Verrucomicrobiota bacterium]MBT7066214.1 sulfatase [Verrucomicrobiota bacterium]MBT7699691.1 sulfatase [Verrucomicrobiota bacterium]
MKQPNLVFVLTDQWRAQAFGYAGDPNVKTPNIDALAARSVNVENAISVCPVCTPQRASLLTGRFPTTTGMFHNDIYLPKEELCIAEILKDAGYDTAYVGKWHLDGHGRDAYIPPERRQGFDYWKVLECTHSYNESYYYAGDDPTPRLWEGYDAYAQTKDAQRYIREHAAGDRPFFLFVGYGGPHFPHDSAPDELKALYPPEELELRPNVTADQEERTRAELQGYYGHCTAIDSCVGDLYRTLEDVGVADNTIFVFTSDHGDMHGSQGHKSWTKQVPWDESVCIPFLLRYPGIHDDGRTVTTPLTTPDILPSLLSLAGVDIPDRIEGDDLSGLFTGKEEDIDRHALFMAVAPFGPKIQAYRGVRNARYTYVRNPDGPWLLYDNEVDPYQMNNLVDDPVHKALRDTLDAELKRQLDRNGDCVMSREEAVAKWGYDTREGCAIPYRGQFKVQSPGPDRGETCTFAPKRRKKRD